MRYYDLVIHPDPRFISGETANEKKSRIKASINTSFQEVSIPGKNGQGGTDYIKVTAARIKKETLHFSSYVKRSKHGLGFEPGGMPSNGIFDPGALDIEFESDQVNLNAYSNASIKIKGLDIMTLGQAANLQGQYVRLSAGMGRGLPLSKPEQAGLILQGKIYSSFGNWEGTDMSLTLYVTPFMGPEKLSFDLVGKKGTPLINTIRSALQSNFKIYQINFLTTNNPLLKEDARGHYDTMESFADAMVKKWKELSGVDLYIYAQGQQFYIIDQTTKSPARNIDFDDLIGQPTWNGTASISFCTPIRHDINIGDIVTFWTNQQKVKNSVYGTVKSAGSTPAQETKPAAKPAATPATTKSATPPAQKDPTPPAPANATPPKPKDTTPPLPKDRSLFNGEFMITAVHHIGQFRSAEGRQWMTSFDAMPRPKTTDPKTTTSKT